MKQTTDPINFSEKLLRWYLIGGRHNLPWQRNQTAYRVWLSEIMLQQTQVKTVIPYFHRFTKKYKKISTLAGAGIDEVLELWAGLGYYSRARNLHKTAQIIATNHGGKFPQTVQTLTTLPGIGRSTAGAILSLAFQIPTPILDGNVKRVLTRFHALTGWTGNTKVQKQLWVLAEKHMPSSQARNYTQAIMDLGATVCMRTSPLCEICPIQSGCVSRNEDRVDEFPGKKPENKLKKGNLSLLVIQNPKGEVALIRRPAKGIWGGLWCFPVKADAETVSTLIESIGIRKVRNVHEISTFNHKLSHIEFEISPIVAYAADEPTLLQPVLWHKLGGKLTVGVPKPVNKIIDQLVDSNRKLLE